MRLRNCTFRGVDAAEVVNHARDITSENVTIEPAKRGRSINSPQSRE